MNTETSGGSVVEHGNNENQGGQATMGGNAEEVLKHARAIGNEVSGLVDAIGGIAQSARSAIDLDRRVREKPVQTLLIAAGVGYIAVGVFFTPFTGTMLRLGTRLWLLPTLRNTILNREELH